MFKLTTINQKLVFLFVLLTMSAIGTLKAYTNSNKDLELSGGAIQISVINSDVVNFDFSYNVLIENVTEAQGALQGYKYYWEKTKDIHDDTSWSEIVGANNNGLNDGQIFRTVFYRRKVVDGNNAIAYSNVVTFYKLEILTHPSTQQQVVPIGGSITPLTVTHSDIDGTPTYQWYVNSKNSNTGGIPISGANSSTYTPDNSTANWGYYYVVISDQRGGSVTSNTSGEIFVGNPNDSISQIDPNKLPQYATLPWYNLLIGDNFDPSDDVNNQVTDLVGNASNPMLQTQRDRILFTNSSTPEFVYYFRVRHGTVPDNNGLLRSSFYLGIDVNGDNVADLFIEANTKNKGIAGIYLHLPDTGAGDGLSPSTTGWENAYEIPNDGESFWVTYLTSSGDYTTNTDIDNESGGDSWLEFAISETALSEFVQQALSINISGDSVITLYVFTSMNQVANGDIAGVNDLTADLSQSWEDLGVTVTSSVNELIELITPTVNGGTFPTTEINLTGTWGGDQGGTDTLSIELNGVTYTEADPQMTININQWLLEINSSMVEAGNSYTITVTAARGTETKTATDTITVLDDNADLASLEVTETNLSLTDPSILTYQVLVGADQEQVVLTAVASSSVASITINGETYASGSSLTLDLNSGTNTYDIKVVAENQINIRTYTVVVLRGYLPLVSEIDPSTDEDGDQGTFEVMLPSQPSGNVTIVLSLSDDTEATLSDTALTFTTTNWNVAQTVTLTGIDDPIAEGESVRDGAQTYQITGVVSSVDELYDGGQMPTIIMSNQDTDPPGIYIELNDSETSESGSSLSFNIRLLSTLLTDDIELSLPLEISDGTEGSFSATQVVTNTTIIFSNAQLSTTVLIYGVDDSIDDGTISYTLTSGDPQAPGDSGYDNLTAEDVADFVLSNLDDDPTVTKLSYFQDHTVFVDQDDFSIEAPLTNNTDGAFSYTISPTSIASIESSSGLISVLAVGSAIITASQASSTNYTSASITATLTVLPLENTLYWAEDQTLAYGSAAISIPIGQTSSTSGVFTYSSANESIATIDSSTGEITPQNVGTVQLTVVQAADGTYEESSDRLQLTVTPIAAEISTQDLVKDYGSPSFDLTEGILSSTSGGLYSFSSSNSEILSVSGSTATILSAGTVVITVVQEANTNYDSITTSFEVTINKIAPSLVPPDDIELVFGQSAINAEVQSNSRGTLSFGLSNTSIASVVAAEFNQSQAELTISPLEVGSTVITVNQAETANFLSASSNFNISVSKAIPELIFNDITATFNDSDRTLSVTTNSLGVVNFTSSDPSIASINGTLISINAAGSVVLTAQLAEDSHYLAASVTATLTIFKDDPELVLSDIAVEFEDPDFNLNASTNSSGAISYQIEDSAIATVNGSLVSILGAGFTTITATQEETQNYNAAQVSATLSVGAISPVVEFQDHFTTYGTASIPLSYSSNSLGAVSFTVEDPSVATISGTQLIIVGAGSTTIVLTQEQDANFFETQTTATLWVAKANPIINTTDLEFTYGDSPLELDSQYVSSNSSGLISYNSLNPQIASIEGATLSIIGAGSTSVEITQQATSNYNAATASFNIVVQKANPLIVFSDIEATYGDATIELSYVSNSLGSVSFSSSEESIAQIQEQNLIINGTGTAQIHLTQEATTNFNAATATMTLSVAKKSLVVSGIIALDKIYDGNTIADVALTNLNLEGLVNGDEVIITVEAEFENPNVGTDIKVDLNSTYAGIDASNYLISDQLTTTASITPKMIQINGAVGLNKEYDGNRQLQQDTTYELVEEFVDGDDVFVIGSPLYDTSESGSRTIVQGSIALSGARAFNYLVNWTNGAGAILPKNLIVSVLDDSKFITEPDPVGYNGVSYQGFVAGESVENLSGTLLLNRTNNEVEIPGLYQLVLEGSGLSSPNYNISYEKGDFTIVAADALVIDIESQTVNYSETPSYSLSASFFSSQLSKTVTLEPPSLDENTGIYTFDDGIGGTASFQLLLNSTSEIYSTSGNINTGTYDLKTTNEQVNSTSFSGSIISTGSLTVLPKTITPNLIEPTKDYDGNRIIIEQELLLEGLVSGDNLLAIYDGLYMSSYAGTNLDYSISSIQLSGSDKDNYILSLVQFNGTDGIISPLPLNVNAQNVTKTYDGRPNENYPLDFSGFISGEDQYSLLGALAISEPANSAKDVGVYPFEISGYSSNNYNITYSGAQLEINAADLFISGFIALDKRYDGKTIATVDLNNLSYEGLVEGDVIQLSSTANFEDSQTGSNKTVYFEHNYDFESNSNYSISAQLSSTASISKAPLNIKADDKIVNYTGGVFKDFTVSYQGFVPGDTSMVLSGELEYSGSALNAISGGLYTIEVSGLNALNYEINYQPGTLTIVEGDIDSDGIVDSLDDDIDGDGILNEGDSDINGDGIVDNGPDFDQDGWNDSYDTDDDNDGLSDIEELSYYTDPYNSDTDADGVIDGDEIQDGTDPLVGCDLIWEHRTILEYQQEWLSLDCDGDGLINLVEAGIDTDQDGILDVFDIDDDGDTLLTKEEGADPNNNGLNDDSLDFDLNGIPDYLEKNKLDPNAIVARDVEVFNAISPNGDGENDFFIIRNIEKYPDNDLFVMNKDGDLVERINSYGQDGKYFYALDQNGEKLPVGVYYYVLRIRNFNLERTIKGYLYINW